MAQEATGRPSRFRAADGGRTRRIGEEERGVEGRSGGGRGVSLDGGGKEGGEKRREEVFVRGEAKER